MSFGALERSRIYGLLAHVYHHEPSSGFLENLKDPSFLGVLKELGVDLGESLVGENDRILEDLAIEYTRLFLGPGRHIYPYESAYRQEGEGEATDAALEVKRLIEASGLSYTPDYRDPPDHVSVELEFMEKLTEAESKAWEEGDREQTVQFLEFEKRFLADHLAGWVPEFAERVIENASPGFYREMAGLTREYVLADVRGIGQTMAEIQDEGGA